MFIQQSHDWKGLMPAALRTHQSFCQLIMTEYCIRVIIVILRNYHREHGINTISGIIYRWVPPNENDIQVCINSVAQAMGVLADQKIDVADSRIEIPLLETIIQHENGQQPYSFDVFVRAVDLAG